MIDLEELAKLEKLIEEKRRKEIADSNSNIIIFQPGAGPEDDFIPPPEPTPAMFYGIIGKMAAIAAEKTEVNPVSGSGHCVFIVPGCE